MSRLILTVFASASFAALGACAVSPKQIAGMDRANLQMKAVEVTSELKIDAVVSGDRLGDAERNAVRSFGVAYGSEGHGKIIISRPSTGPDDVAAIRAAADARAVLLAEGIEPTSITEGPYDATGARPAPLVISYKAWEAKVPGCPDISSYQIASTASNGHLPSFGCAVATNLAAQLANAGDLVGNQPLDPGDIKRQTIILTKYRNGETTAAVRNTAASGAISKAIGN